MLIDDYLSRGFAALTSKDGVTSGYQPLHWQRRLFEDHFSRNDVPKSCDLPTGLGKTSVIHLWLLALRQQMQGGKPRLPIRLVYVVDRRTVVDQATEIANQIKRNLGSLGVPPDWLSISTLRGQFADNRKWAEEPSRPAIIIGTVDMIGSRLLFSGYRSSYKLRPHDAGLLGQDTLLILDEAHLSKPFEKLVQMLSDEGSVQRGQGMPMRVMCMSATAGGGGNRRFKLEPCDLEGTAETNPILQRYGARKSLLIEPPVERKDIQKRIVDAAAELAKHDCRVVVFVRQPKDALAIKKMLERRKTLVKRVKALTGTIRGQERDELLKEPVLKRFLDGEEKPGDQSGKGPVVLVSTSAGEVGFGLNADHMVCEAAPLDSIIQRLGRVNRRGYGDATVRVFAVKSGEGKRDKYGSAAARAIECLQELSKTANGACDASPKALDDLTNRLTRKQLEEASAPRPATVEVTEILLDAWSMTTIVKPMPGRPPVAEWLRGITTEEPETTIAWRTELDIEGFGELEIDDIEEWFDAHRVLPHETLTVPTRVAKEELLKRWDGLPAHLQGVLGGRSCVVERGGLEVVRLRSLIEELRAADKAEANRIAGADLVLPAGFGGIERGEGILDPEAPRAPADSEEAVSLSLLKAPDVADERGDRCRFLRTDSGDEPLAGACDPVGLAEFVLGLPCEDDTLRQLVSRIPKRQRLDIGPNGQSLSEHVTSVQKHAGDICARLGVDGNEREAVKLAAEWHDCGKGRDIWQTAVGRKPGEPPVGKSGGLMKRIPGDYRHEFGSLREFAEAHEGRIPADVFELAMHLIAAHHGRGRPHFPKGGFDPEARAKSPRIAFGVIRRFVRLQRQYGWWRLAWLENLLRCADAMASAEKRGDNVESS